MYVFVAPKNISNEFRRSKWFKTNLGRNVTLRDKDQTRFEISPDDTFVKFYYDKYKVLVMSEGSIGTINFYTDYYINGNVVAIYYKDKEFVFEHEPNKIIENGIDDYIGSIIKEIVTKYSAEIENAEDLKIKSGVDPEKIYSNPGSVTWDDIVAMKKKQNL